MFATLMYHIVDRRIRAPIAVSEEAFEAQLAHLRREGYTILTLDDVLAIVTGSRPPPPGGVFVTFDDGYADNLAVALPRLREQGIEATMFVPTAHVGRSNRWNANARYRVRHLDWDGLERWVEGGGRVGGHLHEHVSVRGLDPAALGESLELNKRLLEERLAQRVRAFAYPYGDVSDEARAEVARLYDVAFSVYDGVWDHRVDPYAINRLAVDHGFGLLDFARHLDRLFASFEAHARRGGVHAFEQFPSGTGPVHRRLAARLRQGVDERRRRLRLVEVGVEWPPETFLERKFERLAAAGVDVRVVAFRARDGTSPSGWRLMRVPRWDGSRIRAAVRLVAGVGLLLVSRPRGIWAAWRTRRSWSGAAWPAVRQWLLAVRLSRIRGDVVHFEWLSVALRWAGLFAALGNRIVVSCHGSEITAYPHTPRWARQTSDLPGLFARAAAVHCVSADVAAEGARHGLDPARVAVIRTAVDVELFRPPAWRPAVGSAFALVSVGQLRWLKGYEWVLAAVAELVRAGVPATLDVVGGPLSPDAAREGEHERILWTVADLGLQERVRLHGEVSPLAVRDHLQAADVLLHLSLAEGLPTVVLEAMACGLPVVATDVGGTREAVTDGVEGFLVPPREPGAAAVALERLWQEPGLRAQMGAAGRSRVEADFGADVEAARFRALYERVALERRRRGSRAVASESRR